MISPYIFAFLILGCDSQLLIEVAKAPFAGILITGRNLFLHVYEREEDMKEITFHKIFENIFEAVPQLTLSCVYIANNGGFENNILNVVSSIFSSGSIIMGILFSLFAFAKRSKGLGLIGQLLHLILS